MSVVTICAKKDCRLVKSGRRILRELKKKAHRANRREARQKAHLAKLYSP